MFRDLTGGTEYGQFASLTPKAMRVKELCQGKSFDEAFAIADREFTSDGMTLKPGAITPAPQEARAS